MKFLAVISLVFFVTSCTTVDSRSVRLEPGMTKQEVIEIMGTPDRRSFKDSSEALQYQGIVGFGQCVYMTAWLQDGILIATTDRRGSSVAGCGLGSREVDWGQMPKPSIDINITTDEKT